MLTLFGLFVTITRVAQA